MDTITVQIVSFQMAALAAIFGFLWKLHHEVINLHKDNADLRERMAKMEGLLKGFIGRSLEPQT